MEHDILIHQALLSQLSEKPYSILLRYKLAESYDKLKFPDLASGEAYMALLLSDELKNHTDEYHEQTLAATLADFKAATGNSSSDEVMFQQCWDRICFYLLTTGCLKSTQEFISRGLKSRPTHSNSTLHKIRSQIQEKLSKPSLPLDQYPERVLVRRELYPWNDHEPDRFSSTSLSFLNDKLTDIAPDLEIKVVELPDLRPGKQGAVLRQLGVFATRDLAPGTEILNEKSLLTATARLNDTFCDACSISLKNTEEAVQCEECYETVFCSDDCRDLAMTTYHEGICGSDVSSICKDANAIEAADSLYSLLLLRVIAMSITQDVHPLDIQEVKYIWGDYSSSPSLPFSFYNNVLLPIHILEKLDVNIFENQAFMPWITNTLLAKFRGTASAKQGHDGLPEVGAVHPWWCLANHSCDPNVRWEWNGGMKFWVREERILWDGKSERADAGIKKGEEISSHYCDIELDVKERREWAAGALGGECACERCIWEADHSKTKQ